MKQIILTLVAGIFLVLGLSACSEKENKNADIVIFSQEGCPHCTSAMNFINNELKQLVPNVTVQEYNIRGGKYEYDLFVAAVNKFGFNRKPNAVIGTPLIVVKNEGLMGWDEVNKTKIINLLKQKNVVLPQSNTNEKE